MKVNFKTVSLALSAAMTLSVAMPAYALEVSYSSADSALSVSGSNTSNDIAVAVMPYSYSPDKLTVGTVNNNDSIVFQYVQAGGDYSEEILLPLNLPAGKYRVSEIIGGKSADAVFFKLSDSKLADAADAMNRADSLSDAKSAVNTLLSGTDSALKSKAGDIAEYMYNAMPGSGYDEQEFFDSFTLYEGIVSLKEGDITFSRFMEEYSSVISEEYNLAYESLTDEQKAEADKIAFIDGDDADSIIEEIIFVTKAHTVGNHEDLQLLVTEHLENAGVELDDFDELSEYEQAEIFIELFTDKNKITGTDYVVTKLEKLIEDILDDDSGSSGGGSSGGGGGGGSAGISGGGYQVGTGTPAPAPTTDAFTDTSAHWAKVDIEAMYKLGIVNGTGNGIFEPDRSVTRAEFVKMLTGALGIAVSAKDCSFTDVANDAWYYSYVTTAVDMGIVKGVSDTEFAPGASITREDAATMVYRAVSSKLSKLSEYDFLDRTDISDYAAEGVEALSGAEILKGSDGYFRPKANITRAEAAALLLRIYNLK